MECVLFSDAHSITTTHDRRRLREMHDGASPTSRRRSCAGVPLVLLLLRSAQVSVRASERDPEAGAEPGLITWRTDYARALDEAKSRNQLIWIQFTGPWCPNCTRMEQDSFPASRHSRPRRAVFVPVKLRSDVNEELALGFGLSGLPATVILAPSREVFVVRQGYLGPDELARCCAKPTQRHTTEQERNRQIASAKASERVREETSAEVEDKHQDQEETHVALSGYCPVSLVSDRKLVPGAGGIHRDARGQALPVREHADLQPLPPRPRAFCPGQ